MLNKGLNLVGWAILVTIMVATASTAHAGTVSLAWDPVNEPDVQGYKVYYSTTPGTYSNNVDVGNVTATTVSGLAECTTWHFAIKAYDDAGNESQDFSNEVSGWPRPIVSTVSPSSAEQGRSLTVTIGGANYQSGASVDFLDPQITVNSVTVNDCNELVASISIANSSAAGLKTIEVINANQVFGSGTNLFTVEASVPPAVSGTNPADGATGVGIAVQPTVTFSETMDPASITTATVRLLDPASQPVAQAAGSPTLSGDGLTATITPAADLQAGLTYRIEVLGGPSGVLDLAGHGMAGDYLQSNGFDTVGDTTGPVISSLQAANVGSTTSDVTWDTDEASDSQVFFRRLGQSTWQQTAVDPALVTSHSVALEGLRPATTYEYYARSADSAGNGTDSAIQQLTTLGNSFSYMRMEAEDGELAGPFRIGSDAGAFLGNYVDTPQGTPEGSATSPSGTATFGFDVPATGTWFVWVRMYSLNGNSNEMFESVDGAARQTIATSSNNAWQWVTGRSYTLSTGQHSVELGGAKARARADRILITNDPNFRPTEVPEDDNQEPGPVSGLIASPSDGQVQLDWTNPADADYEKTVVRFRTDGTYPTTVHDGTLAADRPAAPGSADGFVHSGLTNGTTYYYSVFAVDAEGNASSASRVEETPVDNVAPGAVTNARRDDTK